ncbi:MAG: GspH/FimT family pseudopilin [Comamonadaceae bacterium]|jgi:type IV fimbrial biogenesis protein FimT|uniref:GspH/FimT family pseudopilin n=1 Tax=Candidatus Skiveiella danica TaxID=3386177 RepID=UPI001D57D335|nr:GspH/FimT family pseudopilin [Comamonadaceae bacterium]MBK7508633.1 GspH/FimT family pseudopilin [Comamonadaceae bacterium]MBK9200113.1 GspH/FimT family pseudopilin [Betaproteobacteria bacterium]MBK9988444.1 GspH/FimT family pseudopilin [Betaproteobacteria bacterium]
MRSSRGVTAIELATVIAILAILSALAGPSFVNLIRSNNVSSVVNTFMSDMRFARSEAIRRGGAVIMCRSNVPEAASPTCGTGSGPNGNGWVSGWLVFEDRDNSNSYNSGDQLLRIQPAITTVDSFLESGGSSSTKFEFTANGRMKNLSSATQLQVGSNFSMTNAQQRTLCVSPSGRVRVVGDGTTSCSTATDR